MRYPWTSPLARFARPDLIEATERLDPAEGMGDKESLYLALWRALDMDALCVEAIAGGLAVEIDARWTLEHHAADMDGISTLRDQLMTVSVCFPDFNVMAPIDKAALFLSNQLRGTTHSIQLSNGKFRPPPFVRLEERA